MNAIVNPHAAVGAGHARKPWRIKEWMDERRIRQEHVAERAGLQAKSIVSRTIRGQANNRKVLLVLLELGCPAGYLGLPEDLKVLSQQDKKRVV